MSVDLTQYGWDDPPEPRPKRKRKKRIRTAPIHHETVEYMSVRQGAVVAYMAHFGCPWDEAEEKLRRSVRGALKRRAKFYPGARQNQYRLNQYGPGGTPRMVIIFTAKSIDWFEVRR